MPQAEAFQGEAALRAAWLSGLAPDPRQTVSEWADRHRILPQRAAAEPGPYRTARTPYLREVMDELSPMSPARKVVFMKGAQIGATEVGNNWIGYIMHRAAAPVLAVQPTTELAKRLSQQRIDPLISESPALRELVAPARSRDSGNTTFSKSFRGGQFILTGANSAAGLRSMPARFVFLDEVDAYPGDVDGEGDPVALAEARTATYGHRAKVFVVSTPTIRGVSRVEREFLASDQRRYHVPCPHCGGLQWLKFERLRWPKGLPEQVAYVCEHCEEPFEERHKARILREEHGACWIPTAPPEQVEEARRAGVVGFHLSALYSPLGWQSWEAIARAWEAAQGNDAALKVVKNTMLGETWAERGEAPDWERLYERRGPHQLGELPEGAVLLTAGADVQRDRVEVDVWGWGRNLRSWLIEHVVIEGEMGAPRVIGALDELLRRTWRHPGGSEMPIQRLAIDSGDGVTTEAVYAWVRGQSRDRVMAIKGVHHAASGSPVDGPRWVEVTRRGRKVRRGVQLWTIQVGFFKSETYRYLRLNAPTDEELAEGKGWPAGYIHIPRGITSEWVRQLTAEQLVTVNLRGGRTRLEWQQVRERNEALDCRVYARAAAWLVGIDRWDEGVWIQRELELDPPQPVGGAAEARRVVSEPGAGPDPAQLPKRRQSWLGPRGGRG
ncbi:phage terminase large subunit family protein [Meinhardsimonia xiamenensis]|jgi:phage terminase large subunit GpA-like protein|nr:phage terminase large subunit family protein [Meinhardsimonia xiamenensis]